MEIEKIPLIYLIGSLRNPKIPHFAQELRKLGCSVFDDWYAAGWCPNCNTSADDHWMEYEKLRGHNMKRALEGHAAKHVFEFDFHFLQKADIVVALAPFGRSGSLELGWVVGQGKKGYVLFDNDPERYDVMFQPPIITEFFYHKEKLFKRLRQDFKMYL